MRLFGRIRDFRILTGRVNGFTRAEIAYQRGYDDGHKLSVAQASVERGERKEAQHDARVQRDRAHVYMAATRRLTEAIEQIESADGVRATALRAMARQALKWVPTEDIEPVRRDT